MPNFFENQVLLLEAQPGRELASEQKAVREVERYQFSKQKGRLYATGGKGSDCCECLFTKQHFRIPDLLEDSSLGSRVQGIYISGGKLQH